MSDHWLVENNPQVNGREHGDTDWRWTVLHAGTGSAAVRFLPTKRAALAVVAELDADPHVDPRTCPHCEKQPDAPTMRILAWHAARAWHDHTNGRYGWAPEASRPEINRAMLRHCQRCGSMDSASPSNDLLAAIRTAPSSEAIDALIRDRRYPSWSDAHHQAAALRDRELAGADPWQVLLDQLMAAATIGEVDAILGRAHDHAAWCEEHTALAELRLEQLCARRTVARYGAFDAEPVAVAGGVL